LVGDPAAIWLGLDQTLSRSTRNTGVFAKFEFPARLGAGEIPDNPGLSNQRWDNDATTLQ
jgi:hypothetical protein